MALDEGGGSWTGTTPVLGPLEGPPVPAMSPWDRIKDYFTPKITGGEGVAGWGQFTQTPPNQQPISPGQGWSNMVPVSGAEGIPPWLIGVGALLGGIVVLQLVLGRRR
jgi:hypothetical protein